MKSVKVGEEIISLPPDKIAGYDMLYISVYCEMKCGYSLKIEFGRENSVLPDSVNEINLNNTHIINYKHMDPKITSIEFWAYSIGNSPFTMVFSQSNFILS